MIRNHSLGYFRHTAAQSMIHGGMFYNATKNSLLKPDGRVMYVTEAGYNKTKDFALYT